MIEEGREEGEGQKNVRIVIPVVDENGLNAQISAHFGRAPYFAVIELNAKGAVVTQQTVPNVGEHLGGSGARSVGILQLKPNAVITYGMGPRGLRIFQNANVAVLQANANTVKAVIAAYHRDELRELTEGCHEARHH